jgi:hypothetical protein
MSASGVRGLALGVMVCVSTVLGWSRPASAAEWTVMIYLDGDNNLEYYGLVDFMEMSQVGSTPDVQIVVMMDRVEHEDSTFGNWTDARRGLLEAGDVPDASWGESVGEVNMGDPDTLVTFGHWAVQNYPAERYALVIWNHGNGWYPPDSSGRQIKAIAWDDTSGNDALSMLELTSGLQQIKATAGTIDLLGFDACLMNMVEVVYELRNDATYMVGAETSEVGYGWPYDDVLERLVADPTMTGAALGQVIVDEYRAMVQNLGFTGSDAGDSLAVLDLSRMDTLVAALGTLATALQSSWESDPGACANAASAVNAVLSAVVVHENQYPSGPNLGGLAIYFPYSMSTYTSLYSGTAISFPEASGWDDFLESYYGSMAGSWVSSVRSNVQEADQDFTAHVDLADLCSRIVQAAGGVTDEDGDRVGDEIDNCPDMANVTQTDTDGDGAGDACDPDDDDDGVADVEDTCPTDANKIDAGQCGCGAVDTDADADGLSDCIDECPNDPNKTSAGICGCGEADADANNNGLVDCLEEQGPTEPDDSEVVAGTRDDPPGGVAPTCGVGAGGGIMLAMMVMLFGRCSRRKW